MPNTNNNKNDDDDNNNKNVLGALGVVSVKLNGVYSELNSGRAYT